MKPKGWTTLAVAGLIVAAVFAPHSARAIEVKKDLYNNSGPQGPSASGPAKENPIPKAAAQELSDTIASESDSYVSDESEKKSSGQVYVDLEHAKFLYLPTMKATLDRAREAAGGRIHAVEERRGTREADRQAEDIGLQLPARRQQMDRSRAAEVARRGRQRHGGGRAQVVSRAKWL